MFRDKINDNYIFHKHSCKLTAYTRYLSWSYI